MLKRNKYHKLRFPILSLIWIMVIFSFSLQDGTRSNFQSGVITTMMQNLLLSINIDIEREMLSFIVRKTAHFANFFILGIFVKQSAVDLKSKHPLYWVCIVPIVDETIQSFVPGRVMALTDMVIDLAGIFAGVFFVVWLIERNKVKTL